MKRYEISGKLAVFSPELNPEPNCYVCKNGEIFDRPYFLFDQYGPSHTEPICGGCNYRYKIPRIDCREMTKEGFELFQKYTEDNWEEIKMTPETLELRQIYQQEKECPKHEFVVAQPFTTSLGTFAVRTCPVCCVAQVDYKNKTYQAPTMELLNWIAHESINHTKNQAKLDIKLMDLGIGRTETKPILAEPMLDLFTAPKLQAQTPMLPDLFR